MAFCRSDPNSDVLTSGPPRPHHVPPPVGCNAAELETAERFASLDALYNFRTFRFLETAGIGPGWHCLEVGGGSGSVAAWMAERVGPSGYVLLTDIDPRFIEGRQRHANVELRRHGETAAVEPPLAWIGLWLDAHARGVR